MFVKFPVYQNLNRYQLAPRLSLTANIRVILTAQLPCVVSHDRFVADQQAGP